MIEVAFVNFHRVAVSAPELSSPIDEMIEMIPPKLMPHVLPVLLFVTATLAAPNGPNTRPLPSTQPVEAFRRSGPGQELFLVLKREVPPPTIQELLGGRPVPDGVAVDAPLQAHNFEFYHRGPDAKPEEPPAKIWSMREVMYAGEGPARATQVLEAALLEGRLVFVSRQHGRVFVTVVQLATADEPAQVLRSTQLVAETESSGPVVTSAKIIGDNLENATVELNVNTTRGRDLLKFPARHEQAPATRSRDDKGSGEG